MRYYELIISDPDDGQVYKPSPINDTFVKSPGGVSFTTHPRGPNNPVDPNALNVEIDIPAIPFNQSQGACLLRVWGIGLSMIGQASNFNPDPKTNKAGANIRLSAGMQKGLPLANPKQAGLLLQGTVFQSFGNWQGVNQTLDFIVNPPATQPEQDISFSWPAGTELSSALATTFAQAFGKYGMVVEVGVSGGLTQANDEQGHYTTLAAFSTYIQDISEKLGIPIFGPQYSGVLITIIGNTLTAYDSETVGNTIQLVFTDLIGQPTWIDTATINFKTVLRSDIAVGSRVMFPQKGVLSPYVLTTQDAAFPNAPSRSQSIFKGVFIIVEVHHWGHSRQADADSWGTTFNAVPVSS